MMVFGLEQQDGSLITPMALAHPLHPIGSRSRHKRRNLWVGWSVWRYWFCIRSNWNNLFLRDINIPRVGVNVVRFTKYFYRGSQNRLENVFPCSRANPNRVIATIVCAWRDSCAAVACANAFNDLTATIWSTTQIMFHCIVIDMKT